MAERIVHAIVLRRRDSGESDRRLTVLTEEYGKIDVLAKGARKGGSRLSGVSDPLSAAVMNLAEGKRNLFITQAQPLHSFRGLRNDYDRLTGALALVELFAAILPIDEPFPEAYALLAQSLSSGNARQANRRASLGRSPTLGTHRLLASIRPVRGDGQGDHRRGTVSLT